MRSCNVRTPYGVTYRLANKIGKRQSYNTPAKELYRAHLDALGVAFKASNIADLARSSTWSWNPDPPPAEGSKSFSPRFGITGLPAPDLIESKMKGRVCEMNIGLTVTLSNPIHHPRHQRSVHHLHPCDREIQWDLAKHWVVRASRPFRSRDSLENSIAFHFWHCSSCSYHRRQKPFCVDRKTYAKLSTFVKYVIKFVGRANPITNLEFAEEYAKNNKRNTYLIFIFQSQI